MAERSKIEWCDATFNPWLGCKKVSPACDNCYAESWAKRTGHPELWHGARRQTGWDYWQQPYKWNRKAGEEGRRWRVFCASLADVFDEEAPTKWRSDLFDVIGETPNLDWLLLTKRPENIRSMLPGSDEWAVGWQNVWLGTTVENQEEADRRIPLLLRVPALVRFLSCEPQLGPIDLRGYFHGYETDGLSWIIAGDESGPHARETKPEWRASLRDQCRAASVPFFQKQITVRGRKVPFEDWPDDMKVREFPLV